MRALSEARVQQWESMRCSSSGDKRCPDVSRAVEGSRPAAPLGGVGVLDQAAMRRAAREPALFPLSSHYRLPQSYHILTFYPGASQSIYLRHSPRQSIIAAGTSHAQCRSLHGL